MSKTSKSRFHILRCVLAAYSFVWRERRYLLGLGLLPMSVNFLTTVFLAAPKVGDGMIGNFLWTLPSTMLFGWLMFQQTRLMLFGERIDSLPKSGPATLSRARQLRASVIVWTLFSMGYMALTAFLFWAAAAQSGGDNAAISVFGMIVIGGAFWAVRFSLAHILAAVDYPIRAFIFRVDGIGISLRLFGLGILTVMPMLFVLRLVLSLLVPAFGAPGATTLAGGQVIVIALAGSAMSLIMTLLLNAGGVFALREMLAGADPEKNLSAPRGAA